MLYGTEAKEVFNNLSNTPKNSIKSGVFEYTNSNKEITFKCFYKDDYKSVSKDFNSLEIGLNWLKLVRLE